MYWSASSSICVSISRSDSDAGMEMILVITAAPDTATAADLEREPDRLMAFLTASPTASTSAMFFSMTALAGSGSTA